MGKRVLLVEDHYDTADLMKQALEMSGHTVVLARNAKGAIEEALNANFDVMLCDIGLPDASGFEVMRAIRHNKPRIAVALTGFGQSEDVERCREAGFDEHFLKPVDLDAIDALLARA